MSPSSSINTISPTLNNSVSIVDEDIETGWDVYLENMEKMGIQDMVDAWQMIYDRTH